MKFSQLFILAISVFSIVCPAWARPTPLSTAFTYQGHVKLNGILVTDTADFQFTLWNAASGPAQVAGPVVVNAVAVTNGLFTVSIDFGVTAFNGEARWLEVSVRSPSGGGAFSTLGPRQSLTAQPYSLQTRGIFVDDAGKVGIGTTTPGNAIGNSKLDVAGGHIAISNDFGIFSKNAANNGIGAGFDTSTLDALVLFASGAERARISPGGNLGIGTTTPGEKLTVAGSMEVGTGAGDYQHLRIGGGNSSGFIFGSFPIWGDGIHMGYNFYSDAGANHVPNPGGQTSVISVGYGTIDLRVGDNSGFFDTMAHIYRFGIVFPEFGRYGFGVSNPTHLLQLSLNDATKPTSSQWTILSDRRLKKNIQPIEGALDQLMQLKGVTYQWIRPETQGNMAGTYTGMVAQDVEPVFPEWVTEDKEGYKQLNVIGFEGLAVEALRDLRAEKNAEIASLRAEKDAEIATLRARLDAIEQSMQSLLAAQQGGAR